MRATVYWSAKGDHRQGRICPDLEQVRADTVSDRTTGFGARPERPGGHFPPGTNVPCPFGKWLLELLQAAPRPVQLLVGEQRGKLRPQNQGLHRQVQPASVPQVGEPVRDRWIVEQFACRLQRAQ